jgi:hypothetical protein
VGFKIDSQERKNEYQLYQQGIVVCPTIHPTDVTQEERSRAMNRLFPKANVSARELSASANLPETWLWKNG